MMKKLGMQQEEIDATEVIIKTSEKEIVITEPSVAKVNIMGQETFQISGNVHEREKTVEVEISDDDVAMVAEQANVSVKKAKEALEQTKGNIAEAILKLKK